MSSRLLNQSLGQISTDDRRQPSGPVSRNSPYNRPSRTAGGGVDDTWKHDMFDSHSANPRTRDGRPARGASSRAPTASLKLTGKLTIDNLHYDVSEGELRDLFERIAPVVKAFVKYDRSGRSTGQAVVIYEDADDASAARGEYDGAKAKGQVITISQEMRTDRPPRPPAGAEGLAGQSGGGKDLLSRFDLLSRMGGPKPEPPRNAPKGPAAETARFSNGGRTAGRNGPQRGVSNSNSSGGGGRGRETQQAQTQSSGRGGGREKRKPASREDLDTELEAFMKASGTSAPAEVPAPNSTVASIHAVPTEDVEMA